MAGLASVAVVVACAAGPESRSGGVDLVAHAVHSAEHGRGAALRVAFLPTPESCSPQDLIATRALSRLAEERPDVAVLTLVPRGLPIEAGMAGLPFPGHVVDLPLHVLEQGERKVARPRFEVYAEDGRLLLLRPVYPYEEERRLVEEVLSLLRYSAPADATGG